MVTIHPMNMAAFDLNLLRVLDALLRDGSTVAAGRRVGLSQPAVSAALGRLRAALGDPLFVRRGPRLVPTDHALSLAAPLREHLEAIERLLAGPKGFDPARADRSFRISGADFFADLLMPPLGRLLLREAPGLRVHLLDLLPRAQAEALDRNESDILLISEWDRPDWVEWRPLFHSPFCVIARAGHPRLAGLVPGAQLPLDLFCDLDHVLMSPDGKPRALTDEALERVGRRRRVVMTLPFLAGVCRCVSLSDFVALVPRQLALHLAPTLGLAAYVAPVEMPVPLIGMAWHRRMTAAPPHRWLRDTLARLLEPLDDGVG